MKLLLQALRIAAFVALALFSIKTSPATAQVSNTLKHSIPVPSATQVGGLLGFSVAVEGSYAVAGAPNDDLGEENSGVVKVFDPNTGALLFVIRDSQSQPGGL